MEQPGEKLAAGAEGCGEVRGEPQAAGESIEDRIRLLLRLRAQTKQQLLEYKSMIDANEEKTPEQIMQEKQIEVKIEDLENEIEDVKSDFEMKTLALNSPFFLKFVSSSSCWRLPRSPPPAAFPRHPPHARPENKHRVGRPENEHQVGQPENEHQVGRHEGEHQLLSDITPAPPYTAHSRYFCGSSAPRKLPLLGGHDGQQDGFRQQGRAGLGNGLLTGLLGYFLTLNLVRTDLFGRPATDVGMCEMSC
ncbi:Centromere protein H [Cricetulus griseus]|uniref:Centromere protein H n=1 Tax=Cricetulus griseus TaxID=10029 RepID=G3HRW4_CRIGR|nr:Centromere protein H [Cricetulus griseus]